MKTISIYLAGACRHLEDEGAEWRDRAAKMLQQAAEWKSADIKVINPLDYFTYAENKHKSHKQVKAFYMNKIRQSDIVLVSLDYSDASVGTGQEVQYASCHNIPVIGFGKTDVYPWIAEVDCEVTFETLTEAVDYLRDYYLE